MHKPTNSALLQPLLDSATPISYGRIFRDQWAFTSILAMFAGLQADYVTVVEDRPTGRPNFCP